MDERKKLAWFILARMAVVSLFVVSTLILSVREPWSIEEWRISSFLDLSIVTYLFSLLSLLFLRYRKTGVSFATIQIIWDLLFVTVLLLMTGGIGSPFSFLYLLSIINSSVLLSRRQALYTASLCGILYGAILDLQYFGMLTSLGLTRGQALQYGETYIFYNIFLNLFAFFSAALLTSWLAEQASRSESALKHKEIDFEELERMNGAIIASLSSGLLTVTEDDRIRVFNRFAEQMVGLSQQEVYDRPLFEVIPEFSRVRAVLAKGGRCEVEAILKGERRTVGLSTATLFDKAGTRIGTIVNFQDLTILKRMEAELKRADRLAAAGKLSAAIAHEIRNPLASISGSVQLISQGEGIAEGDRRLLEIVVREADRLNSILQDFLAYTRPQQSMKFRVSVSSLVHDLEALIVCDPRFSKVRLDFVYDPGLTVLLDPELFKQVLWNLFVNAAEALGEGGGAITFRAERRGGEGCAGKSCVVISVADNGSGMTPEQTARIFDPFFTTKAEGSGLGLATVYRIMDIHGGRVEVTSKKGKGSCFSLYLPDEPEEAPAAAGNGR